jgi:hypothetical protein
MKTLALIMAVSADKGIDHDIIHSRSISTNEFVEFLEEPSALNENQPFALFMDNMRV